LRKETPFSKEEYNGDEQKINTKDVQKEIEKYKQMQKTINSKDVWGNVVICCFAILCLTGMETMALYKNIDGKYAALIAVLVGGLGGYKIKDIWQLFQKK